MRQQLNKIRNILNRQDWLALFVAMLLLVVATLLESVGVFSIFPFMKMATSPEVIDSNSWLAYAKSALGFSSNQNFLFASGIAMLATFVLTTAGSVYASWSVYRSIWLLAHRLGVRLLDRYARFPFEFYHRNNSAELTKKIVSDVHDFVGGILLSSCLLVVSLLKAIVLLAMLLWISPRLSMVVFVMYTVVYYLMHRLRRKTLDELGKERLLTTNLRFKTLTELLSGSKALRVSGATGMFLDRFENASERFAAVQPRFALVNLVPKYSIELLAFGGLVAMILWRISTGGDLLELIPVLTTFALATYKLLPALNVSFSQVANFGQHAPLIDVIHDDMHNGTLLLKPSSARSEADPLELQTEIKVDQVCYQYEASDSKVLSQVSLVIPKGSRCALVGTTGCGKSTLFDILVGAIFAGQGKLTVDGQLIGPDNVYNWQNSIGYVPQEVFLYDDTIAANIALGVPENQVDADRLQAAARLAQAIEFIEKDTPNGFKTQIGERGIRLSGGQRQRLGLARAFYRQPSVLFLDEATSALDNVTEEAIMASLKRELPELTVVMIAHRLGSVKDCDSIHLMQDGEVIQSGSYDELYAASKSFQKMVDAGG